jgi:hypothetical protein
VSFAKHHAEKMREMEKGNSMKTLFVTLDNFYPIYEEPNYYLRDDEII